MSNRQFDQTMWNVRERPLSSDENQQASQVNATIRDIVNRFLSWRDWTGATDAGAQVSQGFVADGFKVDEGTGLQVTLRAGLGFQDGTGDAPTGINGCLELDDLYPLKPLCLTAPESITVPAADPSNPRIDIIQVKYSRTVGNPQSRGILNTTTGVFDATLVNKTMSFVLDGTSAVGGTTAPIVYKVGTPAGTPTEPSVDAGYIQIAAVYVPAAASSILLTNIADRRRLLMPGGVIRVTGHAIINLSGNTLDEFTCQAPPGVDVVFGCNVAAGVCANISVTLIGPFPEVQVQGATQTQFGSMHVMCAALDSSGGNKAANPILFSEANGGGSSPFDNPITVFSDTITGFPTNAASPPDWAGGPTGMPKQNQVSIGGYLKQFDGTNFATAPSTATASTSRVAIKFSVDVPVA